MMKTNQTPTEKYEICDGASLNQIQLALFEEYKIWFKINRDRRFARSECATYTGVEVTSVSLTKHLDISEKHKILNIRGFLYHDPTDRNATTSESGKKCKFSCWYDASVRIGEIKIMPQFPVR